MHLHCDLIVILFCGRDSEFKLISENEGYCYPTSTNLHRYIVYDHRYWLSIAILIATIMLGLWIPIIANNSWFYTYSCIKSKIG